MNDIFKKIGIGIIALLLFATTILAASAYSIDADDEYYLKRGDTVTGTFIIDNYPGDITLKSNMAWVSLEKDRYISQKQAEGELVVENSYSFEYYITVPEDAEIGVHRGVIEVIKNDEIQYLNIKISVDNNLVSPIANTFANPVTKWIFYSSLVVIVGLLLVVLYRRVRYGK